MLQLGQGLPASGVARHLGQHVREALVASMSEDQAHELPTDRLPARDATASLPVAEAVRSTLTAATTNGVASSGRKCHTLHASPALVPGPISCSR